MRRKIIKKKEIVNKLQGNVCVNQETFSTFNFNNDPIFIITQYYIPASEKRREELKFVLKKNVEENQVNKIYLLNERMYSEEELGVKSDKIVQIVTGKRLTYSAAFDFAKSLDIFAYYVLCNSDIFFDQTLNNLRRSSLNKTKSMYALTRYEYRENKEPELFEHGHARADSQDTWIIHHNYLPSDTSTLNIKLGIPGCDNKITWLMDKLDYKLFNVPSKIKTYHHHDERKDRHSGRTDTIRPPYIYMPASKIV